jgi:release factor glutamine methyltransferase
VPEARLNAGALVECGARRLAAVAGESARLEAQLLLGRAAGWSRVDLLAHPEREVDVGQRPAFWDLVARREAGEPIAYLLGEREFYGRVFKVDRRALIPRPETELLVELGKTAVARWRAAGAEPTVVDVGTGCGAVAISLAAECEVKVVATDVSAAALALAADNALRLAPGRISFVRGDLLGGLRGPLHVVLANLPYVPTRRELPAEVKEYEPHVALFAGERGTELIERLLREARSMFVYGSELAVELDEEDQATQIAALGRAGYPEADISVCQDAGGYDRVVRLLLPPPVTGQ